MSDDVGDAGGEEPQGNTALTGKELEEKPEGNTALTKETEEEKAATAKAAEEKKAADEKTAADKKAVDDKAGGEAKDGEKPKDGKADAGKDAKGAPDKYEAFTMPKGMEEDKALAEKFSPLAKKFNLSQAEAQELIDINTASLQAHMDAQETAWTDLKAEWEKQTKTDKEIGGVDLEKNLAIAKTGLTKFGTKALSVALEAMGAGDHPEMIRFFYRVGKELAEDTATGGKGAKANLTRAQILYPNVNAA